MMRTSLSLSLLLLGSLSISAADTPGERWRVSVLASEISASSHESFAGNDSWSNEMHPGVGLGVSYSLSPQWDVEFMVASQTHRSPYTSLAPELFPGGQPGLVVPHTEFREYRVTPVDLSVTRHFHVGRMVAPYLRAGVRYVDAPDDPAGTSPVVEPVPGFPFQPVREGFGLHDRASGQAGAGLRVRLTPRTALRMEAMRLLRSEEVAFDRLLRFAVGLTWKF